MESISVLTENNKSIRELLKEYQESRTSANSIYLTNLNKQYGVLDVPREQVPEESEPGSFIEASGAYGPRCKVAQMLSFLETQQSVSDNIITFPVLIDSPNALEQDKEHLGSVLKALFTWNKTENQIIVASIEGKEIAEIIPDVKIIKLNNVVNHIMSKEEYLLLQEEIDIIVTNF